MTPLRLGSIASLALLLASCVTTRPALQRFEYRQRHMGILARVVLYAPDEETAVTAARAAFDRIALLDSLMSDYRSDSELTRLARRAGGPPVRVSEPLFEVLARAQELARLSGGAFDVTAGPFVRLWRSSRRSGTLPTPGERDEAAARVGWQKLHLFPEDRSVRLAVAGMRLDLGGIAKGYAADQAIATLRARGVDRALVEMGGDIVVSGPPPAQPGWAVRVANAPPERETLHLADAAISTSGDTEQFVEIGGERYSHVIDPRTGLGLRTGVAATVIAPSGVVADGLSTLLSVLGPEQGQEMLRHFPGATAYIREVTLPTPSPP